MLRSGPFTQVGRVLQVESGIRDWSMDFSERLRFCRSARSGSRNMSLHLSVRCARVRLEQGRLPEERHHELVVRGELAALARVLVGAARVL